MEKLTARQTAILDFVEAYSEETGYPPTRADIARQFGFRSPNAAEEHLKALARKGAVALVPNRSRAIRVLRPSTAADAIGPAGKEHAGRRRGPKAGKARGAGADGLPIVGRVAAGAPVLALEHIEDTCDLPGDFFHPRADYLLRVQGDSMTNAGIQDGDLLAVRKTPEARNGQIVVARVDDEVTVKRFRRASRTRVQLLPENDAHSPIEVDLRNQELAIEGLSVGLIRRR